MFRMHNRCDFIRSTIRIDPHTLRRVNCELDYPISMNKISWVINNDKKAQSLLKYSVSVLYFVMLDRLFFDDIDVGPVKTYYYNMWTSKILSVLV